MRLVCGALWGVLLFAAWLSLGEPPVQAALPQTSPPMRPDVAALMQRASTAYQRLNTYQHTALTEDIGSNGKISGKCRYTLALARPNRFRYTAEADKVVTVAAICNGKTFLHFHGQQREYIEVPAPPTYARLDVSVAIVIEPPATSLIALLLHGDPYTDKDIRDALKAATLRAVVEKGRKWQVLVAPYADNTELDFYFDAQTHLIGKAVVLFPQPSGPPTKTVEILENIKLDTPLDDSLFSYTPPVTARKVRQFTAMRGARGRAGHGP